MSERSLVVEGDYCTKELEACPARVYT